jgi:hypothetical protein
MCHFRPADRRPSKVEDVERVLGPNHRLTLMARFHLARCTGEAGDAARAWDYS